MAPRPSASQTGSSKDGSEHAPGRTPGPKSACSSTRGKPSKTRPRPRRMVAVARSSPTKLRRNTKTGVRNDSSGAHDGGGGGGGGGDGGGGGVNDTGESDCDDPDIVTDSELERASGEDAQGQKRTLGLPQKAERTSRNTPDRSSREPRAAQPSAAKLTSSADIKPAKRPFPEDDAATKQPGPTLGAKPPGPPPAKVSRGSAEPSTSVTRRSRAGPARASPSVSSGAVSDSDDVVVIEDPPDTRSPRPGSSEAPVVVPDTPEVKTESTTPQDDECTPQELAAKDAQMKRVNMARAAMHGYPCPVCDKKHQTLTQATLHYYTHDVGASLFRCKICNAKFSYWQPAHIRDKHPYIRPEEVFSNMENNFEDGKLNVARLMLKKKKLYSEVLLDLVMKTSYNLNRVRVSKSTPPNNNTLERLASARASARVKEEEEKKTEGQKREKLAALKALRIGKSATSDVKPSASTVKSSTTSDAKSSTTSDAKSSTTSDAKSSTTSDAKSSPGISTTAGAKPAAAEQPSSVPAPTATRTSTSASNPIQRCAGTVTCGRCNFRGISAAVARHEYWHTPEAEKRRDTLRFRCHLCFYASDVAAHVQVHLMCAHFIERPAWDGNGGKPATLAGVRGRNTGDVRVQSAEPLPSDQRRYLELKRYDCPLCDSFFSDKESYKAHVTRFHVAGKPARPCPFLHCYTENVNHHSKWYHKSAPLRNRLCQDCGGTVYHGKDDQHVDKACVRNRALMFECPMPICGFGTRKQEEIDRHLVECHSLWVRGMSGARTSPYACPECPAEVAYGEFQGHLAEHRRGPGAKEKEKGVEVASEKRNRASGEKRDRVSGKSEPATERKLDRAAEKKQDRPAAEKKQDGPAAEKKQDLPAAEKKQDGPAAEKKQDGPAAEKKQDLPAAEKKQDGPAAEKKQDGPAADKKQDRPAAEKKQDRPAAEKKQGHAPAKRSGALEEKRGGAPEKPGRASNTPDRVPEKEPNRPPKNQTTRTPEQQGTPSQKNPPDTVPERGTGRSAEKSGDRASKRRVGRAAEVSPKRTDRTTTENAERPPRRPVGRPPKKRPLLRIGGPAAPPILKKIQPADHAAAGDNTGPPILKKSQTADHAAAGDSRGEERHAGASSAAGPASEDEVVLIDDGWQDEDEDDVLPMSVDPAAGDGPGEGTGEPDATNTAAGVNPTKGTRKPPAEGNGEKRKKYKSAAAAKSPPRTRWNRVSVGGFLFDRCQQPMSDAAFSSLSGGYDSSQSGVERCFFCEFSCESAVQLESHLVAAHRAQVQAFEVFLRGCVAHNSRRKCPICGIGFRAKWVFFRHIMSHSINVEVISG